VAGARMRPPSRRDTAPWVVLGAAAHRGGHFGPAQAIALFTLDGQRRWADSSDPNYPEPGRRQDPGTVFTTSHGSPNGLYQGRAPPRAHPLHTCRARHDPRTIAVDVLRRHGGARYLRPHRAHLTGDGWREAFDGDYQTEIAAGPQKSPRRPNARTDRPRPG
jgi:hypothetical protein